MSAEDWLIRDQHRRAAHAEEILLWVRCFSAFHAAIHELQRERGLSSSYLASRGRQFSQELGYQYHRTDSTLDAAWSALLSTDTTRWPLSLKQSWTTARDQVIERPAVRQLVQTLELTPSRGPEAYSIVIEGLLNALQLSAETWALPDLEGWEAQVALQRWKETFGQERALGALLIEAHDSAVHATLLDRRALRQKWEDELFRHAPESLAARVRAFVVSAVFEQREVLLERLLSPAARPVSVSLFSWYEAASAVMEELRGAEALLTAHLEAEQSRRIRVDEAHWKDLTEGWGRVGKRVQRRYGVLDLDSTGAGERKLLREVERRQAAQESHFSEQRGHL